MFYKIENGSSSKYGKMRVRECYIWLALFRRFMSKQKKIDFIFPRFHQIGKIDDVIDNWIDSVNAWNVYRTLEHDHFTRRLEYCLHGEISYSI